MGKETVSVAFGANKIEDSYRKRKLSLKIQLVTIFTDLLEFLVFLFAAHAFSI